MPEKEYVEGAYCDFFGGYAKIYTLSGVNGDVFYVGCTFDLTNRLATHLGNAKGNHKGSNKKKNEIIRSLNFEVVVKVVDMKWVTGSRANRIIHKAFPLEKKWIQKFLELGYDLCNGRPMLKRRGPVKKEFVGQTFQTKSQLNGSIEIIEISHESVPQGTIGQSIVK